MNIRPSPRRLRNTIALLVPLSALAAACGSDGAGRAESVANDASAIPAGFVLHVGDQDQGLELPLRESGELDSLPYEIEFSEFVNGPAMNEAFAAGHIDVGTMGDTPSLFAEASDTPLYVLGVKKSESGNLTSIMAHGGDGITSVEGLVGQKVATTVGTAPHGTLLLQLEQAGLSSADIELVNVPSGSRLDVLESGDVVAATLNEPQRTRFIDDNDDAVDLGEDLPRVASYSPLVARRAALEDPVLTAVLEDFVARQTRAQRWVNEHPDEFLEQYYVRFLRQPQELAAAIVERNGLPVFAEVDQTFIDHQVAQGRRFEEVDVLPAAFDFTPQVVAEVTDRFNPIIKENNEP